MRALWLPAFAIFCCANLTANCPEWTKDPSIPLCPDKASILDDRYPALAYVVSDSSQSGNEDVAELSNPPDANFTWKTVENILVHSGDRTPAILLPVSDETCKFITAQMSSIVNEPRNAKHKEAWLAALHCLPEGNAFTWQQDYFESFVDPKSGMPVLREVRDYYANRHQLEQWDLKAGNPTALLGEMSKATNGCIKAGPLLPSKGVKNYQLLSANFGGNIEGLPGGLCFHGKNQNWNTFTKFYCPDKKHDVAVNTSWLIVGHVDEIFKLLPTTGKEPCNFAVSYSSPTTAMAALKEHPDEKFLDLPRETLREFWLNTEAQNVPLRKLIRACEKYYKSEKMVDEDNFDALKHLVSGSKLPSSSVGNDGIILKCRPENITNGIVYEIMQNAEPFKTVNQLVDIEQKKNVDIVRAALKTSVPGCDAQFIPTPDLYWSPEAETIPKAADSAPLEERRKLVDERAMSLLPSSPNGLVIGKHFVASNSFSPTFRKTLEDNLLKGGVESVSHEDTWRYANAGIGNLHCSTHMIPFCQPRGAKK